MCGQGEAATTGGTRMPNEWRSPAEDADKMRPVLAAVDCTERLPALNYADDDTSDGLLTPLSSPTNSLDVSEGHAADASASLSPARAALDYAPHAAVIAAVDASWNHDFVKARVVLDGLAARRQGGSAEPPLTTVPEVVLAPRIAAERAFMVNARGMIHLDDASRAEVIVLFAEAGVLAEAARKRLRHARKHPPARGGDVGALSWLWGGDGDRGAAASTAAAHHAAVDLDVITAEALLIRGIMQLQSGEYIKGMYNLRRAWSQYTALLPLVEHAAAGAAGAPLPTALEHSIKFGVGVYYVFLSLVPERIMSLLSLAGFACDAIAGEQFLKDVVAGGGVRSGMAAVVLCTYHLFCPTALHNSSIAIAKAATTVHDASLMYPRNVYFHAFHSVICRKTGDGAGARAAVERALRNAGPPQPLLLRYLLGDVLLFALQWAEARQVYAALMRDIADSRVEFAFAGQLALAHAAACEALGDTAAAQTSAAIVAKAATHAAADAAAPLFPAVCRDDPTAVHALPYYVLYATRDVAHMPRDSIVRVRSDLQACAERHPPRRRSEHAAVVLVVEGAAAARLGRVDEARAAWTAVFGMRKALGSRSLAAPFACYELGELAYREGDVAAARRWFKEGRALKCPHSTWENRIRRALKQVEQEQEAS